MSGRTLLYIGLALFGGGFLFNWARALLRERAAGTEMRPRLSELAIGFVTNFFDTLGIGSFAPTTSLFKLGKVVPDEQIPGTMHIGHTPPVFVQAFLFIAAVQVGMVTLVSMILAAVLGAWLGAGVVAGLPRRSIQIGMGVALLIAATTFVLSIFEVTPAGGAATSIGGAQLVIACIAMFIFGALMTLGIGIYAPTIITVSLLGMNPTAAFPIMMGASAYLMPVAGVQFIKAKKYGVRAALGLALGGLPAVLIAFFIIKSIPLNAMKWLVVVVVLYAAVAMLRSAIQEGRTPSEPPAQAA